MLAGSIASAKRSSPARGGPPQEASADAVLAWLAERQLNGAISNSAMALRKLRGGQVGIETPFNLKVVDVGDGETTCMSRVAGAADHGSGFNGGQGTLAEEPPSISVGNFRLRSTTTES